MPMWAWSRHGQFHGQRFAAHAHASDDHFLGVRVVQADAPEIDRQAVFQTPDHHLEDAAKILALADGAGDLAEQIQPLQLSLQFLFGDLAIGDIAGAAKKADRASLVILQNFAATPHPSNVSVLLLHTAFKFAHAARVHGLLEFCFDCCAVLREHVFE